MFSSDPIPMHMYQYRSDGICHWYYSYCLYCIVLCGRSTASCILLQQGHRAFFHVKLWMLYRIWCLVRCKVTFHPLRCRLHTLFVLVWCVRDQHKCWKRLVNRIGPSFPISSPQHRCSVGSVLLLISSVEVTNFFLALKNWQKTEYVVKRALRWISL